MATIQAGTVIAVEAHGTVVLVLLRATQGWLVPVPFDPRAFGWLLDAEGCSAGHLVGRQAEYNGHRLRFLDGN